MNANRKAFLDMLAVSEGTSTSRYTKCDGYDVIVIGIDGVHELITDFSTHPFANGRPSKVFNSRGETSSAAGRYQFMKKDFEYYRKLLNLDDKSLYPDGPFSPAAQDAWAIQLIRERVALPAIDAGDFETAVMRCKNIWASLPGAGYGQHENAMPKLRAAYASAGGTFAADGPAVDVPIATPTAPAAPAVPGFASFIANLLKLFFRKKP